MKNKKHNNTVPNIDKNSLFIKEKFQYNDIQKTIIQQGLNKNTRCIIMDGVAGTSKTFISILISLYLLKENKIPCINYIRSLIQSQDGETGFLSGDLNEKTMYFNVPLYDKLTELLYKQDIDKLVKEEKIKTYPTSMLRGTQMFGATIIDESQNLLLNSIETVMTRMGEHGILFILGDTTAQNDLGHKTGFKKICEIFNNEECQEHGIYYFKLDSSHIVRSKFVKYIVEKFEKIRLLTMNNV